MNIRLGIYDIFSTIIPGGFYLVAIAEFNRLVGWVKFDWRSLQDIGILPSLALVSVAYIIGSATDRIGSYWHRIFKKRGASNRALDRFKELNSEGRAMILSLRGAFAATKQSPHLRGDCFATCARNAMWAKVNALRELIGR
jgi:hypothetical protein